MVKYLILILVLFNSCSPINCKEVLNDLKDIIKLIKEKEKPTPEPIPSEEPTPEVPITTPTPSPEDPPEECEHTTSTDMFGNDGNLWKPAADAHSFFGGNLVVLFSSKYKNFESCTVNLKNGTKEELICIDNSPDTQIPFSCRSNGNRQTLRSRNKCNKVKTVRVVCENECSKVIFTVDNSKLNQVCKRHD